MTVHEIEARGVAVRPFELAAGCWLVVAVAGTVVGLLERWPAQFGGAGSPAHVGAELMGKGTALSPPIFMIALMVLALGLARMPAARTAGMVLAALVGLVGVVGAFGEVVAAATPDVPRDVQYLGLVGVALSLAVVVTAVRALVVARRG